MHIYFSGIGGAGIGPLVLIAKQAGYEVSGSDAVDNDYLQYLISQGIPDIHVGQTHEAITELHRRKPIDWLVYSSALPKTDPHHPELEFAKANGIKTSKRDELLNQVLQAKKLKLIAIAGTHGKTTTTSMAVWLFKQLKIPVSYSLGAKISFGQMGEYSDGSEYFIYEADEYDYNFLAFQPFMSLISGVDWDHPDIYPSRDEYYRAFEKFIGQSQRNVMWQADFEKLNLKPAKKILILTEDDPKIDNLFKLPGRVNRLDAWLVAKAALEIFDKPLEELIKILNEFPGLSRRFEQIAPGLYSDYAHTPAKIRGALQLAHEVAGDNIVVVYEGLHNLRQHFIKEELRNLFDSVKQLYIVPSYLAREDKNLELLTPDNLLNKLSKLAASRAQTAQLDNRLKQTIKKHLGQNDLVVCFSAGSAGSLDEWLRREFGNENPKK